VTDTRRQDGLNRPPADVVESLLRVLEDSFDLGTKTALGTLGEAVRDRLLGLDTEAQPSWGTLGAISQVAKQETESLDFYYRPHLFPEMSPELRLAHHLQFDLLPRELPEESPVEVAAALESYCHLSGDLLGWGQEDKGFFLWIADVSGHGVRAGLAAGVLHFLMAGLDRTQSLAALARALNENMFAARIPDDRQALYVTAFLMRVSPEGNCQYASAGHPPMMIRRSDGQVEWLKAQGPPIGLVPSARFAEDEVHLGGGETLFLYTDGLLEALSPEEEEFGLERIEDLVRSASQTPLNLSRTAYRQVRAHKQSRLLDDDLTFLAARRIP
jgi:sigma-B regulation protein RsbU (phosphoserine phosphatase)